MSKFHTNGMIMNGKTRKALAAAGAAIGMSAGLVATALLVDGLAAETPPPTTVEPQQPAGQYSGPTTPDAADQWFAHRTSYVGPTTPDAAAHWFGPDGPYSQFGPGETYILGPPRN